MEGRGGGGGEGGDGVRHLRIQHCEPDFHSTKKVEIGYIWLWEEVIQERGRRGTETV